LNETKPRKYSEPAPKYEQSETDKMLESMTPEERAKWIENKLKEFMEAKKGTQQNLLKQTLKPNTYHVLCTTTN